MAENLEKGFNNYLRKASRPPSRKTNPLQKAICSLCGKDFPGASETSYGNHVRAEHTRVLDESTLDEKDGSTGSAEFKIKALWAKAVQHSGRYVPSPFP